MSSSLFVLKVVFSRKNKTLAIQYFLKLLKDPFILSKFVLSFFVYLFSFRLDLDPPNPIKDQPPRLLGV